MSQLATGRPELRNIMTSALGSPFWPLPPGLSQAPSYVILVTAAVIGGLISTLAFPWALLCAGHRAGTRQALAH